MTENAGSPSPSPSPSAPAVRPAPSGWGRSDLSRRVARLPIPPESRPRVARFVEEEIAREIARARKEWQREAIPLAGLRCPACDAPIEEKLREARREEELVQAIRSIGLDKLSREEIDHLLGKAPG